MANTTSAYPHDELFERLVDLPWRSGVTRDRRL
jgi:hypothetical protein